MKLTEIFKLKKPQLSFSDLDIKYQNHFIKQYAITILLGISLSIFLLLLKQYSSVLFVLSICIGYCIYIYSQIYHSLTNHVLVIDAKCINVEKKETNILGIKGGKTCTITLLTDKEQKITLPVPYLSSYKAGDIVRIFANEGTISQINNNTYTVMNPIYIYILAS